MGTDATVSCGRTGITDRLLTGDRLLLDGGTRSELQRRGVDVLLGSTGRLKVLVGDRKPRRRRRGHDFSDRMLRMGDMLYIDVVSVFNGYKTCYYQTFVVGKPSAVQLDVYQRSVAEVRLISPDAAQGIKYWLHGYERGTLDSR